MREGKRYAVIGIDTETNEERELYRSPRSARGPAMAWVRRNQWRRGLPIVTHANTCCETRIYAVRVREDAGGVAV